MTSRAFEPFKMIAGTTAPSLQVGATNVFVSTASALESTALKRVWQGPSGRAVRVAEKDGRDFWLNFGSSAITAGGSTDSLLFLGGTVETQRLEPGWTHVAMRSVSTSTGAVVNITLGYGG